jgi:CRP/FNR family cyclic AMP-dependent transcriptional regulator
MTKWQCVECGYFSDEVRPPDRCPGCHASCSYADVTCYRPECGGVVNPDPMLMGMITQRIGMSAPLRPSAKPVSTTQKGTETVSVEKVTKAALFQGLSDEEVQKVISIGQVRLCNPGDIVFKEGDEAVHIYIVEEGKLAIQTAEKQTVYTASPGDVLGWSTLMLPYKRTASAIAAEKSRVVIIDQAKLQEFSEKNTSIGYKITRNVGRLVAVRMRTAKAMSADAVYG